MSTHLRRSTDRGSHRCSTNPSNPDRHATANLQHLDPQRRVVPVIDIDGIGYTG